MTKPGKREKGKKPVNAGARKLTEETSLLEKARESKLIFVPKLAAHFLIGTATGTNYFLINYSETPLGVLIAVDSALINVILNGSIFEKNIEKITRRWKARQEHAKFAVCLVIVGTLAFTSSISAYYVVEKSTSSLPPVASWMCRIFNFLNIAVNTLVVYSPSLFDALTTCSPPHILPRRLHWNNNVDQELKSAQQRLAEVIDRVCFFGIPEEEQRLANFFRQHLDPQGGEFCEKLKNIQRRNGNNSELDRHWDLLQQTDTWPEASKLKEYCLSASGVYVALRGLSFLSIMITADVVLAPSTSKGLEHLFGKKNASIPEWVPLVTGIPAAYFLGIYGAQGLDMIADLLLRGLDCKEAKIAYGKRCLIAALCAGLAGLSIFTILSEAGVATESPEIGSAGNQFASWLISNLTPIPIIAAAGVGLVNFRALMGFSLPQWMRNCLPGQRQSEDQQLIAMVKAANEVVDATIPPRENEMAIEKILPAFRSVRQVPVASGSSRPEQQTTTNIASASPSTAFYKPQPKSQPQPTDSSRSKGLHHRNINRSNQYES